VFRYYTLHTRQSKQAASRGPAPCLASALGRAAASLRADRAVCRCDCIPLLDRRSCAEGSTSSASHVPQAYAGGGGFLLSSAFLRTHHLHLCALWHSHSPHSSRHKTHASFTLPVTSRTSANLTITDRVFSRHLLARACKALRLHRSPLMCAHPSNPTSNLAPAPRFAPTIDPAQSLFTARESHNLHLLACAGMAVNIHGVHIEQAELLLGATAAPAVRFRSAGASSLQAAGWCSRGAWRGVESGATSSSPLTMIKGALSNSVWWTFSLFAPRRDF
jgi:hypothetical protein